MNDTIKIKENDQGKRYAYSKSRERATTVANMSIRVYIVQIENKTSPVSTEKRMDMS